MQHVARRDLAAGFEARHLDRALSSCVSLVASANTTLSRSELHQNLGAQKSIPPAAAIDGATLQLYVSDADGARSIGVHPTNAPWAENGVTFASFAHISSRARSAKSP